MLLLANSINSVRPLLLVVPVAQTPPPTGSHRGTKNTGLLQVFHRVCVCVGYIDMKPEKILQNLK